MNDRTFAASVLTPYFMAEHRETAERHLKENALLEAAKELQNGTKYVIEITAENAYRHDVDAIETRVKVHIQEPEIAPVVFGIDWGKCKPQPQPKKRRRSWGRRRTWKRK